MTKVSNICQVAAAKQQRRRLGTAAMRRRDLECLLFYNVLLPLTLFVASCLRRSFTSFVYFVFCLFVPLTVSPPSSRYPGHPVRFIVCVIIWAICSLIAQFAYNITPTSVIVIDVSDTDDSFECHPTVQWFQQLGLNRLTAVHVVETVYALLPDVLVILVYSLLLIQIRIRQTQAHHRQASGRSLLPRRLSQVTTYLRRQQLRYNVIAINQVAFVVAAAVTGSCHPCLLAAPYFLLFLAIATRWAFNLPLTSWHWRNARRCALLYSAFHACVIYIYQLPNVYRCFPDHEFVARFLGLVVVEPFACDKLSYPWPVEFWIWPEHFLPMCVFLFFNLSAYQYTALRENSDLVQFEYLIHKKRQQFTPSKTPPPKPLRHQQILMQSSPDAKQKKKSKLTATLTQRLNRMRSKENGSGFLSLKNLLPRLAELKSQNYVICLVVLMAWSLCYHSWFTFVMLVLSFVVWTHSDSQSLYHRLAPYISLYAEFLLVAHYVYSFPLTQDELPDEKPAFLRQLGFEKPRETAPFFGVLLKIVFNLVFWMTLKCSRQIPVQVSASQTIEIPTTEPTAFDKVKKHVQNFWIVLALILLLFISLSTPTVFYRIVYMVFFLAFVTTFAVSFPLFRKLLQRFWQAIIAYCIFVVTLIYTYQFHGIPELYAYAGVTSDVVTSIGLEQTSSSQLLIRLLPPFSFLIVALIQLNFFHKHTLEMTAKWEENVHGLKLRFLMTKLKFFRNQLNFLETGLITGYMKAKPVHHDEGERTAAKKVKKVLGEIEKHCKLIISNRQSIWNVFWRLAEIHVDRVIAAVVVYTVAHETALIHVPLVAATALLLVNPRLKNRLFSVIAVVSAFIVLGKMTTQLSFLKLESFSWECAGIDGNSTAYSLIDTTRWVGFVPVECIHCEVKWHLGIIFFLVFREFIKIRQFMYRKEHRLEEPPSGILFVGIQRSHADKDLLHCMLFLANYFFFKFGVELSFVMCVLTVSVRNDIIALFYVIWVAFLITRPRPRQRELWPRYAGCLAVIFVLQYIVRVGVPAFTCVDLFWDQWNENLIEWLCLPSQKVQPDPLELMGDFCQLLFVSCQLQAFKQEIKADAVQASGDNSTLPPGIFNISLSHKRSINPEPSSVPDFISHGSTALDRLKTVFFMYFHWLTLAIVFLAGTTHVTLFAVGYVFGSFVFLWLGNSLFLRPKTVVVSLWDTLLLYNVMVIFCKTLLQVVGCAYIGDLYGNVCWLIQLLGIACNKAGANKYDWVDPSILAVCDIPSTESGIFYDNLCFAFLLIQRRVIGTEYFKHVIAELKAQLCFASRGAELIKKIEQQRIELSAAHEKKMMDMVSNMVAKISKKHNKPDGAESVISSPTTDVPECNSQEGVLQEKSAESPGATLAPPQPVFRFPRHILTRQQSDDGKETVPIDLERRRSGLSYTSRFSVFSDDENDSMAESCSLNNMLFPDAPPESGVKGLGPLQLLNFAIKKGAIKDAVAESNAIEATHTEMEREMERITGSSDYHAIRRAILKYKAQQKAKPDFDEETFDNVEITTSGEDNIDAVPAEPEVMKEDINAIMTSLGPLTRTEKLKIFYYRVKLYLTEYRLVLSTFLGMLIRGTLESLIAYLMEHSRDYRYIAYILQQEKRIHKELFLHTEHASPQSKLDRHRQRALIREKLHDKYDHSDFMRDESIWELHRYVENTEAEEDSRNFDIPEVRIHEPEDDVTVIQVNCSEEDINNADRMYHVEHKHPEHPKSTDTAPTSKSATDEEALIMRLFTALYYTVLSHSELICYIVLVLNHIHSASLLSMPLPFFVLLWGTMTVPLPSRRFWITVISYTEFMVVIKYVFQFGFFPWNSGAPLPDPFWPPRILGIEKRRDYATWDLVLLMALFMHRNILMSIGMWQNFNDLELETDSSDSTERSTESPENRKISSISATPSALFLEMSNFRRISTVSISILTQKLKEQHLKKRVKTRVETIKHFFGVLTNSASRVSADLYAPMFLCDIICFMLIIFGYSAFGTDQVDGSVTSYFEENKIPGTLVAMLILQFVLIVVDRALFLRKFLLGKLAFQLFLVVFVHIWIFFMLPAATDRLFVNNGVCKLWYFVKFIYFLISAKQIRSGYPKFNVGNILATNYNYFNYALQNAYLKVPFLYEMGLLTDWIWKDTSLALGDWITLHDIYCNISTLKCVRNWEEDFPSPKGVKQRPFIKYGYGGLLLFLIILIIWFPLVLFSLSNTVGIRSLPVECTCRLTVAGYHALFESTAQLGDVYPFTEEEYDELYARYRMSKSALSYIADYTHLDVIWAKIDGYSASKWLISPPTRESMIRKLNGTMPLNLQFEWSFKRAPNEDLEYGLVENSREIELIAGHPIRRKFMDVISGEHADPILIPRLFPSLVKVPGTGKSDRVSALLSEHLRDSSDSIEETYTDVLLELISSPEGDYWRMRMIDVAYDPLIRHEPVIRDNLNFVGFVDKVFPKSFSFITGGGILGLYISIVFLLGQYIRAFVIDSMRCIMFEELPNVDRILDLCHKIFFVRDVSRFDLEEALYANLVFIFRSPATLIRWTKERPV